MTKGLRFETDPTGRFHLVFDATGGLVRVMPVIAGGDGEGEGGGAGGGEGSGGAGGEGGSGAGEGGSGAGAGSGAGGEGGAGGTGTPPAAPAGGTDDLSTLPENIRTELEQHRANEKKNADELKRARDEAAKFRTQAQKRALEKSIEALKDAGVDTAELEKKLEEGTAIDPAELAAAAAKEKLEKEGLAADLRERDVRDAIRDEADEQGANFKLLHGYLLSEKKLSTLDPTADGFAASVKTLVQDTLEKQPALKKGQVPSRSGSDFGGGPTGDKPASLEDAITKKLAKA